MKRHGNVVVSKSKRLVYLEYEAGEMDALLVGEHEVTSAL